MITMAIPHNGLAVTTSYSRTQYDRLSQRQLGFCVRRSSMNLSQKSINHFIMVHA